MSFKVYTSFKEPYRNEKLSGIAEHLLERNENVINISTEKYLGGVLMTLNKLCGEKIIYMVYEDN